MNPLSWVISLAWALSIPATALAALWTGDIRWLGTTIIIVACLFLMRILPGEQEQK